ncbi:uncharacterized protein LAJ45_03204 [Morchella importuna]|uniref:uncharacterized protein n=1 Tax=Morchella importuna TaxID=1174673 RepID=UPI001E8D7592|nr:uncharacterized protein LAJ45_03204 [Morchella importuna]KAH8152977.1 hypothetical protein LAJ45_03204 [Morchella importuna]
MVNLIELQKQAILEAIKAIEPKGTWRCVVTDETSHKLITNVMQIHYILDESISDVSLIENKRPPQQMECVYILTPEKHVVECLISDYARPKPRYTCAHLLWTSDLPDGLRQMILNSPARGFIAGEKVLSVDYFPRESHLFTFRDPSSFFTLYNPECRGLPRRVSNNSSELDLYAQNHREFPPPSNRPRGVLFIVDRAMDLFAPALHEFTYQAMAHDLLPIKEGDKVTYNVRLATSSGEEEEKEMEIGDEDQVWVANRHKHMKDTIERLMADFQKFLGDNKNFVDSGSSTSLYAIRDMMASLPQYQGQKDMYSLHLTMAQECMGIFEKKNLPDVALLEQSLATGMDENNRPTKNPTESLIRLLDDPALAAPDRLRLITLYLLWKDGLLAGDIEKLMRHSQLQRQDERVLRNLDLFGARVTRDLKDNSQSRNSAQKPKRPISKTMDDDEDGSDFSRFVTALKVMLDDHTKGALDPAIFPYTKPELVPGGPMGGQENVSQASLRSAKPTWAKSRMSVVEPRQRVIVFMAGGATYSESRACYEVSKASARDVFLGSTHLLTPNLWLSQLRNARESRRLLDLPADRPEKEVPKHLLEPDPVPKPVAPIQQRPQQAPPKKAPSPAPPVKEMGGLKVHHHQPGRYYEEDKKKKKKMFGVF